MMRRLLALAFFLPVPLLACSSGGGDIPGPGCKSIQSSEVVTLSTVPAGSSYSLQCLAHAPNVDAKGAFSCVAFLARTASGACACDAAEGLGSVDTAHKAAADKLFASQPGGATPGCLCEIQQITAADGANLKACTNTATAPLDTNGNEVNGYCFVDGEPTTSNPALVADCPSSEKRALRFVGRPSTLATGDVALGFICQADDCTVEGE